MKIFRNIFKKPYKIKSEGYDFKAEEAFLNENKERFQRLFAKNSAYDFTFEGFSFSNDYIFFQALHDNGQFELEFLTTSSEEVVLSLLKKIETDYRYIQEQLARLYREQPVTFHKFYIKDKHTFYFEFLVADEKVIFQYSEYFRDVEQIMKNYQLSISSSAEGILTMNEANHFILGGAELNHFLKNNMGKKIKVEIV